jgi:hypothetical protein
VKVEKQKSSKNEVVLSFAINMPENKEINDNPKTAIPGDSFLISNKLTGTLA